MTLNQRSTFNRDKRSKALQEIGEVLGATGIDFSCRYFLVPSPKEDGAIKLPMCA